MCEREEDGAASSEWRTLGPRYGLEGRVGRESGQVSHMTDYTGGIRWLGESASLNSLPDLARRQDWMRRLLLG